MPAPLPRPDEHHEIAAALRALPLESPPESVWPSLAAAARSARRRSTTRRWRPAWAAAAATAGLAVALAWLAPRDPNGPAIPEPAATTAPSEADARIVADLVARNQALEQALRETDGAFAIDADYAMAGSQVEELIAAIDGQLAAEPDPRTAEVLWRVRLGLLQELSSLRSGGTETLMAVAGTTGVVVVPADLDVL